MKNSIKTLMAGAVLLAAPSAFACQLTLWDHATGGVIADQPQDFDTQAVQRYSGLCGAEIPDGETGPQYVGDDTPVALDRIIARFYVLDPASGGLSNGAVIFRGYSADNGGGSALFTVIRQPNGAIVLRDNTTNQNVTQNSTSNWASVEIDWQRGAAGSISLSVNGQAPTSTGVNNSGAAQLESVRLGNLNDAGGTLSFDAYESRRTQAIGRLLVGDASADGSITGGDLSVIASEILGNSLASGQPDCTEDGQVTGGDLSCVAAIILGS